MNNTICTSCKLLRLKTFRNFYAAHAACQHSHKCLSMFGSFVCSSPSSTTGSLLGCPPTEEPHGFVINCVTMVT